MTFPSYISYIFRTVICIALVWEVGYILVPDANPSDRVYRALLKVAICFTAIISYINDKEKMLVISNKGLLIEEMIMDERTLKEKLSFAYIVIAIVYNPILPLFYASKYWVIMHLITIIFFWYKVWHYKKQLP